MRLSRLENYTRGWIIGNFSPSLIKTDGVEVAILQHPKGVDIPIHYHKLSEEYNVLVSGSMVVQGTMLVPGDVFVIEINEWCHCDVLEDSVVVCVKMPSVIGDKYVV